MPAAAWKLPSAGTGFGVAQRAALYPALYLHWSGADTVISSAPTPGQWSRAPLRVLIADGPLGGEDQVATTEEGTGRARLETGARPASVDAYVPGGVKWSAVQALSRRVAL